MSEGLTVAVTGAPQWLFPVLAWPLMRGAGRG